MKRFLPILLSIIIVLSLCSCGEKQKESGQTANTITPTETESAIEIIPETEPIIEETVPEPLPIVSQNIKRHISQYLSDENLPADSAINIKFVLDKSIPSETKIVDVSQDENESVLMWLEDNTFYIQSANNTMIAAPESMSHMFDGTRFWVKMHNPAEALIFTTQFFVGENEFVVDETSSTIYISTETLYNDNTIKEVNDDILRALLQDDYYMLFPSFKILSIDTTALDTTYTTVMNYTFAGNPELQELNISNLNTANVEEFTGMFSNCPSLTELDLAHFDTTHGTDFSYMFYKCSSLKTIKTNTWNTESAMNMSYMFSTCPSLIELDITSFNTANVSDFKYMFASNENLQNIKMNFHLDSVVDMQYMFWLCPQLKEIKFSEEQQSHTYNSVETAQRINLEGTFLTSMMNPAENLYQLEYLDLTQFNISAIRNAQYSTIFENNTTIKEGLKIAVATQEDAEKLMEYWTSAQPEIIITNT